MMFELKYLYHGEDPLKTKALTEYLIVKLFRYCLTKKTDLEICFFVICYEIQQLSTFSEIPL